MMYVPSEAEIESVQEEKLMRINKKRERERERVIKIMDFSGTDSGKDLRTCCGYEGV